MCIRCVNFFFCRTNILSISLTRSIFEPSELYSAGERHLPQARVEETTFVLQELARLVIHTDTLSVLPLHPYLKEGLLENNSGKRQHLFVLFPSFCELVVSR